LELNQKAPIVERKVAKEKKVLAAGTFQKTVGDIVKQDKKLSNKPQRQEAKATKPESKRSKPPTETKEVSGPVSFGVKSLEQIRNEKTHDPSEKTDVAKSAAPSQQPASTVQTKDSSFLEGLRKKNQQKFAPSLQNKPSSPPQKAMTTISPKRQAEEPTRQIEQKRQKVESQEEPEESAFDQTGSDDPAVEDVELDPEALALQELLA